VSDQFDNNRVDAVFGKINGNAKTVSLTYSHYYGDWKHTTCITDMKDKTDQAVFDIQVTAPGDYQVSLEYNCPPESEKLEGSLTINNQEFLFRTLRTAQFDKKSPLMLIKHTVATTTIKKAGLYQIVVHPLQNGKELFKLKSIILEPVK
jgi:alpha-L-fucosidase